MVFRREAFPIFFSLFPATAAINLACGPATAPGLTVLLKITSSSGPQRARLQSNAITVKVDKPTSTALAKRLQEILRSCKLRRLIPEIHLTNCLSPRQRESKWRGN